MKKLDGIRRDFPLFTAHPRIAYLDSTATSLKPLAVIAAEDGYYREYSANIYRGIYGISEQATARYEGARGEIARFIGALPDEIVFVRNATEGLNLLASTLADTVGKGDGITTTVMEHHSNFVPWQQLAMKKEARLAVMDITDEGILDVIDAKGNIDGNKLMKYIGPRTRICTLTYVSNVLGTVNPIEKLVSAIRKINPRVFVIVDAAQAVPHQKVDVGALGCDALVFSGHKMLGPTGIGVLWAKKSHLQKMPPYMYGGEMIERVSLEKTTYKEPPFKYEAGTPHIAGVIGLGAAATYLSEVGWDAVTAHERDITSYALEKLSDAFGGDIRILGPLQAQKRGGIIAFTLAGCHPHDVASILDEDDVAVRAGTHCAMPLHDRLGLTSTVRASFYIYSKQEDADRLVAALKRARSILARS